MRINLKPVIIYVLSYLITSWIVYALWNCLFPKLFDLPYIGYIESIGLYSLSNILFKNTSSIKIQEEQIEE